MARLLRQRTLYADGQVVHGPDLTADLLNLQTQLAQYVGDALGGWGFVVSGWTATAAGGMALSIAPGIGYTQQGIGIFSTAPLSVTVSPNTSGAPRTDVLWVQDVTNTAGTNAAFGGSGLPNSVETITAGITPGTPGKVTLGDPTKIQIGSIVVQNGATDLTNPAQATINPTDYAPNSQGPLPSWAAVLAHLAQSIVSGTVHGAQATSAGGLQPNRLAYTDPAGYAGGAIHVKAGGQADGDFSLVANSTNTGPALAFSGSGTTTPLLAQQEANGAFTIRTAAGAYFAVQTNGANERFRIAANGNIGVNTASPSYQLDVAGTLHASTALFGVMNDGGGTGRGFGTPGSQTANAWVCSDGIGYVWGARLLADGNGAARGATTPGGLAANAVAVTDGNGAVALAQAAQSLINGHKIAVGKSSNFSVPGQNGVQAWSVTLSDSSFTPTAVVASLNYVSGSIPQGGVFTWLTTGYAAGSVSGNVYGGSNNGETAFISVVATN